MVEKYRRGDGAQHLAVVFGCSPNTVIRAVKAALDPEEYERLKDRRGRRPGPAPRGEQGALAQGNLLQDEENDRTAEQDAAAAASPLAAESAAASPSATASAPAAADAIPPPAGAAAEPPAITADSAQEPAATATTQPLSTTPRLPEAPAADTDPDIQTDAEADGEAGPGVLAIDDADDFGEEDEDLLTDDDGEDASMFVPVPLLDLADAQSEIRPRPLEAAELPLSAYMLVDKTVELQPRPLREITELGRLPDEELERRALQVYVNPRQAKRLCGRTQRVIKIPDTTILTRTASYLLAQGISRVVIEGALFALPGS